MKKNFKFLLVALLAFIGFNSASAAIAVGDPINDDDYYYEVKTLTGTTGTVYITSINSAKSGAITLPTVITKVDAGETYTFTVTGIKDQTFANAAFKNQTSLTSVTVPADIEYIGSNAFYGCTNLNVITFASGSKLKQIADQAFVTIRVEEYDFTNCTKLVGFPETGSAFVETGKDDNSYITTVTLPTSTTFKTIATSLAKLSNLETLNISASKIQSVVAKAFENDAKLTVMELPTTIKTIATDAFTGSAVEDLTIHVDALTPGTGNGINANVYAAVDKETLTKLTLTGTLKGRIGESAFVDHVAIEDGDLDLSGLNFGTNASIEANAFGGLDLIESITLGNIGDNGSGAYTIQTNAFNGDLLSAVTIGDITAPQAIAAHAFDDGTTNTLTSVTINSVRSGGLAIEAAAFNFAQIAATKKATVTIGAVRAQMLSQKIFGAGAFTFNATNAGAAEIEIGAIESAGSVFTAATFANSNFTKGITLTFAGDIEYDGIDVAIFDSNANLAELNFNGKVGAAGVGSSAGVTVFGEMPEDAEINFTQSLAEGAVAANAFVFSSTDVALTVNYTGTPDDPSVNPFDQDAFKAGSGTQPLTDDAARFVTLNITNTELKALIADGQRSVSATDTNDDIIYGVILLNVEEESLTLKVYQKTGSNISYGRWYINAIDYPDGIKIARRGNDGVKTLTLYTTYVEDDADHEVVEIKMQPIISTDGYYYLPASAYSTPLVILAKATGTSAEETEIEYEAYTTGTASNFYTDNKVKVSTSEVTNQQLRDGSGDVVVPDAQDLYFIINPANHNGISAPNYDFRTVPTIHLAEGSFYLLATHYEGSTAARIVWLDGDDDATAIENVKTVATEAGVVYNLAGQKVDANYKGIVIKNGQKLIQK